MRVIKSKTFKYFIVLLFFLFLFVSYDINFHGPDEPTYFSYTASIIEKGDLNIVNQFYRSGKYISKTYNLPAPHYYGGILLWAPFYAYAKDIYSIADKLCITTLTIEGLDRIIKCAMSFSTIVFGFLAMFFTYWLLRIFFSGKVAVWSIFTIFLGTPFFYYTLYRPGNANIISCLFSILSILFCSYMVSMKKLHWFLYGAFFSICVTVKTDLWLQVLFIVPLFVVLCFLKKIDWKNSAYFISGFIPVFISRVINAYLKYGSFHLEEARFLLFSNTRTFYFFNGLFSFYRGLLYISPIYYICLLGFILIIVNVFRDFKVKSDEKKMRSIFLLTLTTYAIVKLFLLGNDFPEEDFGARFLITEFPIFALLYAQVIHERKRYLKYFIGIVSVFFILWNLLLISETITGLDWVYTTVTPEFSHRFEALKYIFPLFYPKDLGLKLKLCLPLLPVIFLLVFYLMKGFAKPAHSSFWYKVTKDKLLNGFSLFTIYLCISYAVITLLNVYNNKKNVEKLKASGFFENAELMETPEYNQEDFFIPRIELMQYYALKGRLDMYTKIRRYKDKYFAKKDTFGNYSSEAFKLYNIPGVSYRKKDSYNKAIECLNASIQLDPEDVDSYMNLGQIYSALNENDKAVEYFKKIIQLNPKFTHAYIRLGLLYIKTADYSKAIKFFEDVVRMRPSNADAYSYLGDSYYQQGNYDKAIFNYEKAIYSDPTRNWTYSNLGECYRVKGDYKKGAEYLQKYFHDYPANPWYCQALGDMYVKLGDRRNALKQVMNLKELKSKDLADWLEQAIRKNIKNN
jgi:tetratricopeptide (TPR) repeat protein